jgi:hypothetical protein
MTSLLQNAQNGCFIDHSNDKKNNRCQNTFGARAITPLAHAPKRLCRLSVHNKDGENKCESLCLLE